MGFFSLFSRKRPTPRTTGPVSQPVDQVAALNAIGQRSFDVYYAPGGGWSWSPPAFPVVEDGTWQANWNALPPVFRAYYGRALMAGVSAELLRQVYQQVEGHSEEEGAQLVRVMAEGGRYSRIEAGQLVYLSKNWDGSMNRTVLADLRWPEAPTYVSSL